MLMLTSNKRNNNVKHFGVHLISCIVICILLNTLHSSFCLRDNSEISPPII